MKIIHIVEPFAAGLVTFIKTLVDNHEEDEHIVIHGQRKNVMPLGEVRKLFPSYVKFIHWKNAQREVSIIKDLQAFIELYRILKQHRDADIIHLHSSKAGLLGRVVCFLLGIHNVLFTPNGVSFINDDISKRKSFFYATLERLGNLFPGQVIASSHSERVALKSHHIQAGLITNGTEITKSIKPFRSESSKKPFKVVTCGRIAPQKAPNLFNRIAKSFEGNPNFEFVWIGSGIERHKIDASNVRITGWVNQEQVNKELMSADLYLSTARWEGLPFAVLEAMNLGLPLLLSRCIGNNDLVEEAVNGFLFEKGWEAVENIRFLSKENNILQKMSIESHRICAEKFRKEDSALAYKKLYFELLQKSSIRRTHPLSLHARKTAIY